MNHVVMATIVEIHVPLAPTPNVPTGGDPFPWIDQIEDFLVELEDGDSVEVQDDGEEYGDVYVFFIGGASEAGLLAAASRVAALDGVPAGVYAMVSDDGATELGLGRRVDLPLSRPV